MQSRKDISFKSNRLNPVNAGIARARTYRKVKRIDLMCKLVKVKTEWRDTVLEYILVGTRQLEYPAAGMSVLLGLGSALAVWYFDFKVREISIAGKLSVMGTSIILALVGVGHLIALIGNNRKWRVRLCQYGWIIWVCRGAASVILNWPRSTWVSVVILTLFFAIMYLVAWIHNGLILKGEWNAGKGISLLNSSSDHRPT